MAEEQWAVWAEPINRVAPPPQGGRGLNDRGPGWVHGLPTTSHETAVREAELFQEGNDQWAYSVRRWEPPDPPPQWAVWREPVRSATKYDEREAGWCTDPSTYEDAVERLKMRTTDKNVYWTFEIRCWSPPPPRSVWERLRDPWPT